MVTMFVTAIPANAWVQYTSPSQVSGSDYTDYPAFAQALDAVFAGDIDLFTSSSFTTEVSLPLGSRVSMSKAYYMYSTSRKTSTYGWTCFIYSNGVFNRLFGEYVHIGTGLKNCYIAVDKGASKMTYDLLKNADIRAGAYIRTSPKSDGSYYGEDGHSMIILSYDSTHITYLEGNGDGKGLVRVTKRTYAEFNSAQLTGRGRKITHIVQPTEEWFNELYGNSPKDNTYTFSYNANGGGGSEEGFIAEYGGEFSLSSPNFDRDTCVLAGWKVQRDSDGKWYTANGWLSEDKITATNEATTFKNGEIINFDDSFITDTVGDVSYTAYAVWAASVYDTCEKVSLVSSTALRESYPVDSTVSFEGSVIEFTFASGENVCVTVDGNCNSETPQTFRLNGYNYNFYIDGVVSSEGDNPCYVRLDELKGEFTTLRGGKTVSSTEFISAPRSISGENATVQVTYTDGTSETLTATRFVPETQDNNTVSGIMWTDGGFTVNWSFEVKTENGNITITYPSGYSKNTVLGDADLDGSINTSDLAYMKIALTAKSDDFYTVYCASDFDGDGKISTTDLAMIKLHLAGN